MARQGGSAQREEMYQENGGRRNPYLVDYEGQRRRRPASGVRPVNPHRQTSTGRTAHRVRPEGGYAPAGRGDCLVPHHFLSSFLYLSILPKITADVPDTNIYSTRRNWCKLLLSAFSPFIFTDAKKLQIFYTQFYEEICIF